MGKTLARTTAPALFALGVGLAHCGAGVARSPGAASDAGTGADASGDAAIVVSHAPSKHFPAGSSCRATRPVGYAPSDGGEQCDVDAGFNCACGNDSECTAGTNGRCVVSGNAGPHCDYDACFAAKDCDAGTSCACGDLYSFSFNLCVPSNCRVDTDCGAVGFCSPTLDPSCGDFGGEYAGVYCHTPQDECIDDSDCASKGGPAGQWYCAYATDSGKWTCSASHCAG